ncbi:DNA polymerase III, subunits gamma and tau [mine drainage metagenome]
MTDGAANAFLKTLEEPPGPTVFILETSRPRSLKATIRSRCTRLRIQNLHSGPGAEPSRMEDPVADARRALIGDYARLLDGEIGPLDLEKHRATSTLAEMAHDWSFWLATAAKSRLGWPAPLNVPEPLRIRLERLSLATLLPLYTQARETERLARTSANDKLAREALLVSIFHGGGHDGRERQVT